MDETAIVAQELQQPQYASLIALGDDMGCAALLNTHQDATDVLPPPSYSVQDLLLEVGAQGVLEMSTAGLLPLLGLAGPSFDFGKPGVTQMIGALLTGSGPTAACPHCLDVLPTLAAATACSRFERLLAQRGRQATSDTVAHALGRGG